MVEILGSFSNTQLFWLLIMVVLILGEVVKHVIDVLLTPLRTWLRSQNRSALRDKFAAHALSGLISWEHNDNRTGTEVVTIDDLCHDAYRYADTMLKVRKEVHHG